MKLRKLLEGVAIQESNASLELNICGVTDSSCTVQEGMLFIAVSGYSTDGHRFIPDAIKRGAAVIVCEREMPDDVPWVRVENARTAMAKIGANWYERPAEKLQIIGVTGTNGKTSVTYLLKSLLENALQTKVGLIGTIHNMCGNEIIEGERTTPGAIELQGLLAKMHTAGCKYVVMEVSSHALVQQRVDEISFAVGAFTNLTEDHLDFHHTMEEYGRAKALLFTRCQHGVFNLDDEAAGIMRKYATCTSYTVGQSASAELRAENIVLASDHIEMDVCEAGKRETLKVGIPGRFTVSNCLVALGIARSLGIELKTAVAALSTATGVKGRIEVVPTPNCDFTVLIDYAHTPDGLENVLRSVRDFSKRRIITVFGCGGDRDRAKRPIMGRIAAEHSDLVIVTSDNPRTENPQTIIEDILRGMNDTKTPYIVEENRREAIRIALRSAQKDDMIVLAGKGHETYQILGKEKTHLDEREEVASALCEMQR